jgi:hypothetical protein
MWFNIELHIQYETTYVLLGEFTVNLRAEVFISYG